LDFAKPKPETQTDIQEAPALPARAAPMALAVAQP
jgi:hypothetical protein